MMLTYQLGLVGTASKGRGERKGREKELGSLVKSSIQQLEKAQLAIVELYQENRELWSQLAMKNQEVLVVKGSQRKHSLALEKLREARDTIVSVV
jgi:hypothetical protein